MFLRVHTHRESVRKGNIWIAAENATGRLRHLDLIGIEAVLYVILDIFMS